MMNYFDIHIMNFHSICSKISDLFSCILISNYVMNKCDFMLSESYVFYSVLMQYSKILVLIKKINCTT